MADGDVLTLSRSYPYTPPKSDRIIVPASAGACDANFRNLRERLHYIRFSRVGFRFERQAGGELLIAAQTLSAYTDAPGQPATGTGLPYAQLTEADTNADAGGGIARGKNARFIMTGFSADVESVFVTAAGATAATQVRYVPWLRAYRDQIVQSLAEQVTVTLEHGQDSSCVYSLGPIATWSPKTTAGRLSGNDIPGAAWLTSVPDVTGTSTDQDELVMSAVLVRGIQIDNDPLDPTVAGLDVFGVIRFGILGFPTCETGRRGRSSCDDGACDVDEGDEGDVMEKKAAQLEREAARLRRMR